MKKFENKNGNDFSGFLGEGINFKGVLNFNGTFRIDCKFEGEIYSKDTLIIGENAVVKANINVGTVFISGKVMGNINAIKRIEICSKGEVFADITTPSLKISEGVVFQGNSKMLLEEKKEKKETKLSVV